MLVHLTVPSFDVDVHGECGMGEAHITHGDLGMGDHWEGQGRSEDEVSTGGLTGILDSACGGVIRLTPLRCDGPPHRSTGGPPSSE